MDDYDYPLKPGVTRLNCLADTLYVHQTHLQGFSKSAAGNNRSIHRRITTNCNKCHAPPFPISKWQKMPRIDATHRRWELKKLLMNGITFTQAYAPGCSASYFFDFSIAVFASTYTTAASVTVMTMRNVGVLKAFFWKTPH